MIRMLCSPPDLGFWPCSSLSHYCILSVCLGSLKILLPKPLQEPLGEKKQAEASARGSESLQLQLHVGSSHQVQIQSNTSQENKSLVLVNIQSCSVQITREDMQI